MPKLNIFQSWLRKYNSPKSYGISFKKKLQDKIERASVFWHTVMLENIYGTCIVQLLLSLYGRFCKIMIGKKCAHNNINLGLWIVKSAGLYLSAVVSNRHQRLL